MIEPQIMDWCQYGGLIIGVQIGFWLGLLIGKIRK